MPVSCLCPFEPPTDTDSNGQTTDASERHPQFASIDLARSSPSATLPLLLRHMPSRLPFLWCNARSLTSSAFPLGTSLPIDCLSAQAMHPVHCPSPPFQAPALVGGRNGGSGSGSRVGGGGRCSHDQQKATRVIYAPYRCFCFDRGSSALANCRPAASYRQSTLVTAP